MKRTLSMKSISMFFIMFFLLFATPFTVRAQESEMDQLRRKITELEGRIRELESQLEGCYGHRAEEGTYAGGWRNKKNWRKLDVGMPQGEVSSILGEPVKVIQGIRTLWYYPNIYCGYVSFGEDGRLTGWSEP